MELKILKSKLVKTIMERDSYYKITLLLAVGLILSMFVIGYLVVHERVILTPPEIEKTMWVSNNKVSAEYLRSMSFLFVDLRLNLTPDNAAIKHAELLRYTEPNFYGSLKSLLVEEEKEYADKHITSEFDMTSDIKVNPDKLQSLVVGDLKINVGEIALPPKHVEYIIEYALHDGRLTLKSFTEVKHA